MKNIFLLCFILLISCGKQEEPIALDLGDEDGDQILNKDELGFNKYVADFPNIEKISGKIRFSANKMIEVSFSNDFDINEKIFSLLTDLNLKNEKDYYFGDQRKLRLQNLSHLPDLIEDYYTIHLSINLPFDDSLNIGMVTNDKIVYSEVLSREMKFNLKSEELKNILNHSSHFYVFKKINRVSLFKKDLEDSVRSNTRRLYFSDGKDPKILFISKKLSFFEIQKYLKVNSSYLNKPESLLFQSSEFKKYQWFSKEFENGDNALIYTSKENLRKKFLEQFVHTKSIISRKNGVPENSINLMNRTGSKVLMIIRSIQQKNLEFREEKTAKYYRGEGGGGHNGGASQGMNCTHYLRNISNDIVNYPGIEFLFDNLLYKNVDSSDSLNPSHFFEKSEMLDERGIYWELNSNSLPEYTVLILAPRNSSTFVMTGEYHNSCSHAGVRPLIKPTHTNSEALLSFEIDTYVEKN
jgi:hypothetical protein